MGAYAVFYCWERKEYIDPADIDNGPCKPHQVMHNETVGKVLMMLLVFGPANTENNPRCLPHGSWPSVRMTADDYPHDPDHPSHEEITNNSWNPDKPNGWTDVTQEAVAQYNYFGAEYDNFKELKYTPDIE